MSDLDFGVLLPHVGVFGGVRRFLELGNTLLRRGHRYVLYHPEGTRPTWMPFAGEVRRLGTLREHSHRVLVASHVDLAGELENACAELKLFYCVHKDLPARDIVRHRGWILLANSGALQQRLWRRHRVRAEDAIGGVDLRLFRPRAPAPEPPFRVLVFARTSRAGKGTRVALAAAERAAERMAPQTLHLVLFDHVGPGNEPDPRRSLHIRLPHDFHLNLPQEELAHLFASCHLFLSAERRAGWSNTVAEAMAAGVPVVCTRAGTLELATHDETACVVRWRHAWTLARALVTLWRDPQRRERLRRAALQRVQRYSWERVADRLEAIARARLALR
ncbi:MAG: glycosyltransferase family 4 protein [Candidatus Latescibacterota bacterium]|nr:MAG: glycosyltransferase family 4 protein [Candidatus Latescibacterota bacterium]